jgi:hypothetical protein
MVDYEKGQVKQDRTFARIGTTKKPFSSQSTKCVVKSSRKSKFVKEFEQSFKEIEMIEAGKLPKKLARQLLNELENG